MHNYFNYHSRDDEKRYLSIHVQTLKRSLATQRKKREEAQDQLHELEQENKKQYQRIEDLEKELEEIKRQRDTYKNMLFKKNVDHLISSDTHSPVSTPQRKRGGQTGHTGYGRKLSEHIDFYKRVYTKECPDCQTKLKRSPVTITHTVEDIPPLSMVKPLVTQYSIERQWCTMCKKEVTAKPVEVIPGSKLGINLITLIMMFKYGARVPFDSLVFLLNHQYGITVSKGGIVQILHRTKEWLGPEYTKLKQTIRASPVKYADETGWRIHGINNWIWTFLNHNSVCYQVEESRGKGVPHEFFKDSHPADVVVHDDYAAYKNLPFHHQSCWAHMLRKSHEAVIQPTASAEVKILHNQLKNIYGVLLQETQQPFIQNRRQKYYDSLLQQLTTISTASYQMQDAKRIQTRVRNQNKNLLTALLYQGVPLTNNHAERTIRPLVVTRKISGGSRSYKGAQTHMTNMSIFQTIKLKNQPLIPTLREYLLTGAIGKN